jgi:AcrR family transcriptional regulator
MGMGRRPGARNADFEQKRQELLRRVRARLLEPDGARASFRELAAAAEVGPATMRHYFGSRTGVVQAALEQVYQEGLPYLMLVTRPPTTDLRTSLEQLLQMVVMGMNAGVGHVHALGLAAGLRDPDLGPAYLDRVLEPTLQAFEAHLAHHAARCALREGVDLRVAALALLSPMVLGALHQNELGGTQCRPLDLSALVSAHLDAWLRGYASDRPPPGAAPS